MKYAFQLALVVALGGSIPASARDGEPTSGRVTPVTLPSYRVISQSLPQCFGDAQKRSCLTTREIEVLETQLETDPIVWIGVVDARKDRTDDPKAGVMNIKVLKPSYTAIPQLYKAYIETTICPEGSNKNCVTTLSVPEPIYSADLSLE